MIVRSYRLSVCTVHVFPDLQCGRLCWSNSSTMDYMGMCILDHMYT